MVSGNDLAQAGFKYIGTPYSQLDCQAFVEKCLSDCGLKKNLPGSNAWYRTMTWVGTPEECRRRYGCIPTGAFLYILLDNGKEPEQYKRDGKGNASHIGIFTGTGKGAIHSSASLDMVCESEFKGKTIPNGGWNQIGLWNEIDYGKESNMVLGGIREVDPLWGTVISQNGKSVNLRTAPNKSASVIVQIPSGTEVEILDIQSDWCPVRWNGHTGYMMTEFLKYTDDVTEDDSSDMIEVSKAELQYIYDKLGGLLGLRG